MYGNYNYNMKQKIRSLFIPAPGKAYIAADLSQAESWIVAYLCGSDRMKYSLLHSDIHTDTAVALFHEDNMMCNAPVGYDTYHKWQSQGKEKLCLFCKLPILETERYMGKQNNHANGYGMGAERQAQVINKQSDKPPFVTVSISDCRSYQSKWHGLYPEIKDWHSQIQYTLYKTHQLITPYGFKRTFFGRLDDTMYKAAYAFIPQSSVCYHFGGAVQRENPVRGGLKAIREDIVRPGDIDIVNMSHDSLVLELPENLVDEIAPQVYNLLKRPMVVNGEEFTIPVDVEVGYSYGEMKEWKKAA